MLEIEIGERVPFTSTRTRLRVLADLLTRDHQVSIMCPWNSKAMVVKLSFTPPLTATWRLHTVQHRKFVQVQVTGQCDQPLYVENPQITTADTCRVVEFNSKSSQVSLNIYNFFLDLVF